MAAATLAALALGAQLAGTPGAPEAAGRVTNACDPRLEASILLADIRRDQDRAFIEGQAAGTAFEAAAGLEPTAGLWIKLRQGGVTKAYAFENLASGVTDQWPAGQFTAVLENGVVRVYSPADPFGGQAYFAIPRLVRALFDLAIHLALTPFDVAVVAELGGPVPESVCLIREDAAGRLVVTYRTPEQLKHIQWFAATGGVSHGYALEGDSVAFYRGQR